MGNIMVTGISGFVGKHLAHELIKGGWGVVGLGHETTPPPQVSHRLVDYIGCDLTDSTSVKKLSLKNIDAIINLAGLAAVGKSFEQPEAYRRVNVAILANLCQLVKQGSQKGIRVLAISTGAVYASGQELPLREDARVDAKTSPYALSKVEMEKVAEEFLGEGYDCIVARPFNHIGPGQSAGFLLPDLYEKIKTARGGKITVGNIDTKRDYTDVRDVARAYIALATQDKLRHNLYNICSGTPVSGATLLDMLKGATGHTNIETIVDSSQFRPSDAAMIYGDNSRLRVDTGWEPTIPLSQTVGDFVAEA